MSTLHTNRPTTRAAKRQRRVPQAHWQAGVTANASSLRPLINGEPNPLCFACNVEEGWAKLFVAGGSSRDVIQNSKDSPRIQTVYGRIELIPCPHE